MKTVTLNGAEIGQAESKTFAFVVFADWVYERFRDCIPPGTGGYLRRYCRAFSLYAGELDGQHRALTLNETPDAFVLSTVPRC